MKSAREIKMLRCGKGFFTAVDMVGALAKEGIEMTRQSYSNKERGKSAFTAKEIRGMATVLGIDLEEAFEFFSQ